MSPEQSPKRRGSVVPLKRRWSTGNCVVRIAGESSSSGMMTSSLLFHVERLSPSRVSIDSGFVSADSSFPGSPESLSCAAVPNDSPLASFDHIQPLDFSQDEPLSKRQRMSSSSPEPESTTSSVLPVPTPEPEPRPETATTHHIECPPTTSNNLAVTKLIDDESLGICFCEWEECKEKHGTDNQLYDHVIKAHLEQLRPKETPKPQTIQKARSVRRGNAASKEKEEDETSDKYECHWGECEMTLTRGDDQKKFEWLVNHYTTRHAPRAQPYGCVFEGCTTRFRTQKMLVDHVRSAHDDTKPVRKNVEEKSEVEPKTCYIWKPIVSVPLYFGVDYFDERTREWIEDRVKETQESNIVEIDDSTKKETATRNPAVSHDLVGNSTCQAIEEKPQNVPKQPSLKKTVQTIAVLFGRRKRQF